MKSFFSRIQNRFDASYGGRYIENILLELSLEDDSLANILGDSNCKCYLETEYRFQVSGRERIADIAILTKGSHELISLIEIKYEDHKCVKNSAQLQDYIKFCNINGCGFTYLTQFYPPKKDVCLVENAGYEHLLFSQLAERMQNQKLSQLTSLFVRYLEDKGLSMKTVDPGSLYRYMVRLFNPVRGHKKVQNNRSMIEGIPESFQSLMNNISIIAQELSRYTNGKKFPVVDFRLFPCVQLSKKRLQELVGSGEGDFVWIRGGEKNGGELFIFARSVILDVAKNTGDWLYLEYGYRLSIERGAEMFNSSLYASVYGKNKIGRESEVEEYKDIANSTLSNKSKCLSHLVGLVSSVSKKASNNSESTAYRKALNGLCERLDV